MPGRSAIATTKARGATRGDVGERMRIAVVALALIGVAGACGVLASVGVAAAHAACPNADFRLGASSHLPDCRAYEQVSPVDKNGFDIEPSTELANDGAGGGTSPEQLRSYAGTGPAAPDGAAAIFNSGGAFAGSSFGGVGGLFYIARRGEQGWGTHALLPSIDPPFRPNVTFAFDRSLRRALHLVTGASMSSDPVIGTNIYGRDTGGSSFDLLVSSPSANHGAGTTVVGALDDPSHFYFTDQAILVPPEPGLPDPATPKLYEYDAGEVRLASRQPADGAPFSTSVAIGSSIDVGSAQSTKGAVSESGRHVFFTTPHIGPIRQIYRHSDGATVLASPSKLDPPDPAREKVFIGATGDGNRVFFTSSERLTADANVTGSPDLYRYDIGADRLTNLSAGTDGDTPATVQGIVDFSDDGNEVYFVANGQVVPGQGTTGERNLFLWRDNGTAGGVVRFVATLNSTALQTAGNIASDQRNWSSVSSLKSAQMATNGVLVFQSRAPLMAGFDNTQAPGSTRCSGLPGLSAQPCSQVYRYDPDASGGAGDLACLSCRSDGERPLDYTYVPVAEQAAWRAPRMVSDDGERVVFGSRDPLLPADSNGRYDAYLWQASGNGDCARISGCLSLLSSGTAADDAYPQGLSATGDDAFFRTLDRLVPQDGDTLVDLYTARVGGGLEAQQLPAPARCDGDSCQGQPAPPSDGPLMTTGSFNGTGDVLPAKRLSPPRVTRKRVQAGARVRFRVRVDRPGLMTLSGRDVRTVQKFVARKGVYRVTARLKGRAKRALRHRGRRVVKVKVAFRATTGGRPVSRTVGVTLRARTTGRR